MNRSSPNSFASPSKSWLKPTITVVRSAEAHAQITIASFDGAYLTPPSSNPLAS